MDQHLKLSFSHIMKHWKKKEGGDKSVLLRFYPAPVKGQKAVERKAYEQHENSDRLILYKSHRSTPVK